MTLHQLWGVITPEEAVQKLNDVRLNLPNPSNLEEWILSQVGEEIYKTFIYGYTKKQWGREPSELPSSIIKRLPIRTVYDDNYFNDKFQGIPTDGYTKIFENLLKDIPLENSVDYLSDKDYFDKLADKIVYTGPIDEFFNYDLGELEWRSLRFEEQFIEDKDFQGIPVINYSEFDVPFTRIVEHKHFQSKKNKDTIITKEFPQKWDRSKEKYYPVNDTRNNKIFNQYRKMVDKSKYLFGGRLANYKYYDMHQVVGSALSNTEKEK